MRTPRRQRAFTLLELIVVCVLLALLGGGAAAAMGNLARQREGTAARQVQRDLSYARQRAVATGLRTWVVFSPAADRYDLRVESLASPGLAGATPLIDPATNRPFDVRLNLDAYDGVDLAAAAFDAQPSVGFDYLGRPLNSTGAALAAAGSVTLSGGHVVLVQRGSGLSTYTPPP